jgi:hypothetical protein
MLAHFIGAFVRRSLLHGRGLSGSFRIFYGSSVLGLFSSVFAFSLSFIV